MEIIVTLQNIWLELETVSDATLFLCFAAELIGYLLIGLSNKITARIRAHRSSSIRVFRGEEYSSPRFDKTMPDPEFGLFGCRPRLVLAHYINDQIVREEFYNLMGERSVAQYENGEFEKTVNDNIFDSPLWLCFQGIPLFCGFPLWLLSFLVPTIKDFSIALLSSGVFWVIILPWLSIIPGLLKKRGESPEV
jgi:hypothetical protein